MVRNVGKKQLSVWAKLYASSGALVIVGLVLMYWSQSIYFVAGNAIRVGSIVAGFFLIMLASIIRAKFSVLNHLPMLLLSGAYFVALALLSKVQNHAIVYDSTQIVFNIMCLMLFCAGYVLAVEKGEDFLSSKHWSFVVVALVAAVALMAFMRFVKQISFAGASRDYAETGLNPVGVAYANMCLSLIFLVLGVLSESVWRKVLYILVGSLASFIVLSSASKGAVLWGAGAIVYFVILTRHRRYFSLKNLGFLFLGIAIVVPILFVFYKTNYGIAERIDVLIDRFELMFLSLAGGPVTDGSSMSREYMWLSYLNSLSEWVFLGERNYQGYPHNQWLEMLVRFGLLGLPMLFMSILVLSNLMWRTLRFRFHPDLEYSVIATLFVFSYLQSMSSLSLHMNRALWLGFGYFLGYMFVNRRRMKRNMPMRIHTH